MIGLKAARFLAKPVGQHLKLKIYVNILLMLLALQVRILGQEYSATDFIHTEKPKYNSQEHLILNWSDFEFTVSLKNDSLSIERMIEEPDQSTVNFYDGTFIGIDRGEFRGGGLWFYPSDSNKSPIQITTENVALVFVFKNSVYFTEARYIILPKCKLKRVKLKKDEFRVRTKSRMFDMPRTQTVYKNKLFLVSDRGLYVFNRICMRRKIFRNMFWNGLYPNSITAIDKRNLLIGMRSGYAHIDRRWRVCKFYSNPKFLREIEK